MTARWERLSRVKGPLVTRPFLILAGLSAVALALTMWRELTGLGYVTGLNDGYSWGLFKNVNVTTLTALGSGGYAVAVLVWLFDLRQFHPILRTAVLTSLLGYSAGMLALGADVGRPWNFVWIVDPRRWNQHSVLLEVAVCMTSYVLLALHVENMPPVLERIYLHSSSLRRRTLALGTFHVLQRTYPFGVALAFVLPSMHQSSLGSLMYLAGPRVHPLWQTPLLPLFYLLMAYILGFTCVVLVLMLSSLAWRLGLDTELLGELSSIASWMTLGWLALRIGDLAYRDVLGLAFRLDEYSLFFLPEVLLLLIPALGLRVRRWRMRPAALFRLNLVLTCGGLYYRYAPTTMAFMPGEHYVYFPSVAEILMTLGFVALAVLGFLVCVKHFAILPEPAVRLAADAGGAAVAPFSTL
jgi:Ni/Fe-hydrogenase subunit HybB-like protein